MGKLSLRIALKSFAVIIFPTILFLGSGQGEGCNPFSGETDINDIDSVKIDLAYQFNIGKTDEAWRLMCHLERLEGLINDDCTNVTESLHQTIMDASVNAPEPYPVIACKLAFATEGFDLKAVTSVFASLTSSGNKLQQNRSSNRAANGEQPNTGSPLFDMLTIMATIAKDAEYDKLQSALNCMSSVGQANAFEAFMGYLMVVAKISDEGGLLGLLKDSSASAILALSTNLDETANWTTTQPTVTSSPQKWQVIQDSFYYLKTISANYTSIEGFSSQFKTFYDGTSDDGMKTCTPSLPGVGAGCVIQKLFVENLPKT